MSKLFNTDRVLATLDAVLPILRSHATHYWLMGSLVPTAYNGSLFREIHDLDIIITTDDLPLLLNKFFALGYFRKKFNIFRVSELLGVYVFSHPTLLDIGFFVINTEVKCYTIRSGFARIEIPTYHLKPHVYTLHKREFTGIGPEYSYALSLLAKNNPKRAKEIALYISRGVIPATWPLYTMYLFGRKSNWVIDGLNRLLVIIGSFRVRRGLSYDPWQ